MNKKELQFVEQVLKRCTPLDLKVVYALSLVQKDLAAYEARKGQLRESYEVDLHDLNFGGM